MITYIINSILILLLICAFMTIYSYNPVYSALFLTLTYVLASGLLLILKFEFIALIIIVLYVGAVAVLFVFVIFMIDIKSQRLKYSNFFYFYNIFFSFVCFLELLILISKHFFENPYQETHFFVFTTFYSNWLLKNDLLFDIEAIGQVISTNFTIHLLITGLVLFLGVLGSTSMTFYFKSQKTKLQLSFKQLSKKNGSLFF